MFRRIIGVVLALLFLAGGLGLGYWFSRPDRPVIQIESAWVRPATNVEMPTGMAQTTAMTGMSMNSKATTSVYGVIWNTGRVGDRLLRVETDVAEMVQIHQTQVQNEMAMMFEVEGLNIPPLGKLEFKPRASHIMLMHLRKNINPGDHVDLVFYFEKSGPIKVTATVPTP